jgi:hypothetical protein
MVDMLVAKMVGTLLPPQLLSKCVNSVLPIILTIQIFVMGSMLELHVGPKRAPALHHPVLHHQLLHHPKVVRLHPLLFRGMHTVVQYSRVAFSMMY